MVLSHIATASESDFARRLNQIARFYMTDKQLQFIAWLITTATDKCQTIEEVKAMNEEIRKHSLGLKEDEPNQ